MDERDEFVAKRLAKLAEENERRVKKGLQPNVIDGRRIKLTYQLRQLDNGWRCAYCGRNDLRPAGMGQPRTTIDHVMPRSLGGDKYAISNMVLACMSCNVEKADQLPIRQWAPKIDVTRLEYSGPEKYRDFITGMWRL